jgi:hypothetical protein
MYVSEMYMMLFIQNVYYLGPGFWNIYIIDIYIYYVSEQNVHDVIYPKRVLSGSGFLEHIHNRYIYIT